MSEYESALLGAVLAGYRDVPALTRIVSAADFEQPRNGHIWSTSLELHAEGTQPNPLTVMERMGSAALRLPGGATYLTDLDAPVVAQAPWYAEKVRESAIRRQIAGLGARCQQMLADVDTPPEELVTRIRSWADEIGAVKKGELAQIGPALERVIDIAQHGEPRATPTPWQALNDLIGGFQPGQLVTIGAQSGAGKSLALENIATHVARTDKCWVLFVSLEMSATEVTQRTLAHTARVEYSRLRSGRLTDSEWDRVNAVASVIADTRIAFAEQATQTVQTVRAAASDLAQQAKRAGERLGMVVVDYIQLLTSPAKLQSRQQEVGSFSRGLKSLAREFDVTVVTAAQLNRQPGAPTLAHLREAADIANDSDIVMFLHEDTVEEGNRVMKTGEVTAVVAKQRAGPTGAFTLLKRGHYAELHDPTNLEETR